MPAMAAITVKKNDGTTDVIYTSTSPSAGNGNPAIWRNDTVGTAMSHRPELRLTSREGGNGVNRVLRATFVWPQVALDSTTNVSKIVNKLAAASDWTVPKDMPATEIAEAVSQYANLLASALIKQSVKDGFAPT